MKRFAGILLIGLTFQSVLAFVPTIYLHAAGGRGLVVKACAEDADKNPNKANFPPDTLRRQIVSVIVSGVAASLSLISPPAFAASKDLKEDYRQGTAALAEDDKMAPVPREAYKKLGSGVIYADLRPGSGDDAAKAGSRLNLQWVLRKSNGYFVDSSERNDSVPFIFTVGDGNAIVGLDEGVRGMKTGGVRRILIPPSLAYVKGLEDDMPGPIPTGFGPRQQMRRVQNIRKDVPGEYIYLEVQLTRLRQ
jgi:hypothetical protein